jgi:hypothetical protein
MRSVNNGIGFGLVIWVFLLAFFCQAAANPASVAPGRKVARPARYIRAKNAAASQTTPAQVLAGIGESPDDPEPDKPCPGPGLTAGMAFTGRSCPLPAGQAFSRRNRGAATPLYLWHGQLRL